MTITPGLMPKRRILFAFGEQVLGPRWIGDVGAAFEPTGLVVCPARSAPETIRCIEQGGLSAAVVVEDQRAIDGLSLLRIIRSIDNSLPCWLLTQDVRRTTLEAALALQVTSVLTSSIDPGQLAATLCQQLTGIVGGSDFFNR